MRGYEPNARVVVRLIRLSAVIAGMTKEVVESEGLNESQANLPRWARCWQLGLPTHVAERPLRRPIVAVIPLERLERVAGTGAAPLPPSTQPRSPCRSTATPYASSARTRSPVTSRRWRPGRWSALPGEFGPHTDHHHAQQRPGGPAYGGVASQIGRRVAIWMKTAVPTAQTARARWSARTRWPAPHRRQATVGRVTFIGTGRSL